MIPLVVLLVLAFARACFSMDDNFWESLGALAHDNKAISHFFQTGQLPGESAPSGLVRSSPASPPQHSSLQPHSEAESLSEHLSDPNTGPSVVAVATDIDWIPPPLSLQERTYILDQIAPLFDSAHPSRPRPVVIPYVGQELTPDLLKQSFAFRGGYFRELQNGYYIIPKPKFGVDTGGQRAKVNLAFVWERFETSTGIGSIFRLVGHIDSDINTNRRLLRNKSYRTGGMSLTPLGTDSVIDYSGFVRVE